MAWIRKHSMRCGKSFCNRDARWEVMNSRNSSQGVYCKRHAQEAVDESERRDKADSGGR